MSRQTAGRANALSLEQLIALSQSYQEGSRQAAEQLLEHYAPYLGKWLALLLAGRWDADDSEIAHFLGMVGSVDLRQTGQLLARQLRAYERVDLEQEVKLALLETILKYKDPLKQYRYVLKDRIKALTKDPLIDRWNTGRLPEARAPGFLGTTTELDSAWVDGLTCGPEFIRLSWDERRALQLHYAIGYTIAETAKNMGVSDRTVNRILARARKLVKEARALDEPPV